MLNLWAILRCRERKGRALDGGRGASPSGRPSRRRCIEHLGRHPSGRFSTLEEFEEAQRCYPEPIWASEADLVAQDPDWTYTSSVSYILRA